MTKKLNILALSPHADDVEIAMGGTIAKYANEGHNVTILTAILPKEKDYVKIRYSRDELEWVQKNEYNIWQAIVKSEILFTSDVKVIRNFFGDGPFTPGLPEGAPSRAGVFMGWQMVRDYMDANPELKLPDLMEIKPSQYSKIYRAYNPES